MDSNSKSKNPPVVPESLETGGVGENATAKTKTTPAAVSAESTSLLQGEGEDVAFVDTTSSSSSSAPSSAGAATTMPKGDKTEGSSTNKEKSATTPATSSSKSSRPTTASSSSYNNNRTEAVSVERKEELLLEARVNRLQWVHRVALPYRLMESPDDPWVQEEGLANFLQKCHAAALMPSMTKVLSLLYGMEEQRVSPEDVASRIETLLGSLDDDDAAHSFVRPGRQLLEAEIKKNEGNEVLTGYQSFWNKLQTPECASLVQGMRTAIRNLDCIDEPRSIENIAERLKSYVNGTYESLKAHPAWKVEGVNDRLKHSLESFIYGQCFSLIQSKLWTGEAKKAEEEWVERLAALQFVTPKHLDIACMASDDFDLEQALTKPMEELLSTDLYYSPYEKLQRILAMYHGVNAALSKALNRATESKGGAAEKQKLPSADDILPTIILTVLKGKPARMITNLRMVEVFSPPEYLRGEAGYAYTNLFGAVQFLLDLDMEDPKSLSIGAEEFRKGLEESRAKFQERLEAKRKRAQLQGPKIDTEISLKYCDIPASEIRQARQQGRNVDLDWAMDWQKQKIASDEERVATTTAGGQRTSQSSAADDILPPGFSRTYTFLTARPEDIRMSDLPQLLSEYRMLVHTSETLLGERASRLAAERKKKVNIVQEELLANVRRVDPSLLPDNPSM